MSSRGCAWPAIIANCWKIWFIETLLSAENNVSYEPTTALHLPSNNFEIFLTCFISAAVWPILGLNSGIIRTVKIWRTPCLLFKTIDYINWRCYISVIVSFKCWTAVMGVLLSVKLLLQTLTDVMNMSCVNINDGYTSILHHTTSTQPTQPTVQEALKTKNILVLFSSKNLLWKLMKKWLCIFSSKYIVAFQLDYIENLLYLPLQYSLYKYMALL